MMSNGYATGRTTFDSYEIKRREIFYRQRMRNRKAELRKKIMIVASLILMIFVMVGIFSLNSRAVGKDDQKFKYYTSIQLTYGDTLWSIADKYMDADYYDHFSYIAEVKSINHIHDENSVTAGKYLIVPYYSTDYVTD